MSNVKPHKPAAATVKVLPRTTPSLRLRRFVRADAAPIMALNAEASTRRWLPSHVYSDLEGAWSTVAYLISCYSAPGHPQRAPYVLAVEHRETGRLLGHVGFSPLGNDVEVSYAIGESFRGRGYGIEALVYATDWLTESFTVSKVLALTSSENVISRRLLERASYVHLREEVMPFQGHEQLVSSYCWYVSGNRGGA